MQIEPRIAAQDSFSQELDQGKGEVFSGEPEICMGFKTGRMPKFSSPHARGLEVHFSCIRSHIGLSYSDFTVLNLDIEIVNLVPLGRHVFEPWYFTA